MKLKICVIFLHIFFHMGCKEYNLEKECDKLQPLDMMKREAQEGEWLYNNSEPYMSLQEYINSNPPYADSVRKYIYVVKLGTFDTLADSVFGITKKYLSAFFCIEVKQLSDMSLSVMPDSHIRENGQVDAAYVLDSLLVNKLPHDAHSVIALSTIDLYPGNDWNYVFGLASLQKRVGIWSISRFLEYDNKKIDFNKSLIRTLHTASHETAHMFGIKHCSTYECNMNGSNSLSELDRQVSWLCHDCISKLCFNRNIQPKQYIESMNNFYKEYFTDSITKDYYATAYTLLKQ